MSNFRKVLPDFSSEVDRDDAESTVLFFMAFGFYDATEDNPYKIELSKHMLAGHIVVTLNPNDPGIAFSYHLDHEGAETKYFVGRSLNDAVHIIGALHNMCLMPGGQIPNEVLKPYEPPVVPPAEPAQGLTYFAALSEAQAEMHRRLETRPVAAVIDAIGNARAPAGHDYEVIDCNTIDEIDVVAAGKNVLLYKVKVV